MLVFHLDMSGNDFKDEQSKNKPVILLALLVFHFEISGIDSRFEHLENIS